MIPTIRHQALTLAALLFAFALLIPDFSASQTPSGEEILQRIDENISSDNRVFTSQMIIHGRRGSRTILSKSWAVGEEKSYSEYLAPAREKGTKMLKLEDMLWMYSPFADRIIQISGHMLRQSVMGSDLSYEDMMEDSKLTRHYAATVTGDTTIDERSCWKLELTARTEDVAYHSRKLCVDKERYIPLREELFAKSGKLLKILELKDIKQIKNRWYPGRMIFKDVLKTGGGTEFVIESIEFDVEIPEYIFSKASLKK
ncbi:outer membrane lipoprotein-sorting protein [candidate division KSB1 bacterium]|nr:outer membrane lipoprotein-sorting protein [candidate division KSB1 bacterium]